MAKDTFASRVEVLQKARAELHKSVQSGDSARVKRALAAADKAQDSYLEKVKAEKERLARLESF